ncbi:V-type H+-transporting ATPase subunit H [Nematocida minor]|uniref:V-type H+-transporting ATPase subunit H n=1 Tax=Nematocida minor TaxID=1912983 RepID=UPI00221F834E|nr:V-type H+-transporting ATPase subunit H [Nematocida minor]KAI5189408.1 V-type H+-transporting ATPase subunit H [Nematocida minor]
MGVQKYFKELREEVSSKDKIRGVLMEIGGLSTEELNNSELLDILLSLSQNNDLLISLKALQILTRVYRHNNRGSREYYRILSEVIKNEPDSKKTEQILIFLQRLATLEYTRQKVSIDLFIQDPIREEIAKNNDLVGAILNVCTKRACKYQGLLLLWILTFSHKALSALINSPMFYMLSFISKDGKEKELRVSLGIVRNYLEFAKKYNYETFQKIEELLSVVSSRGNKEDPEEQDDLKYCREKYFKLSQDVSTFDVYLNELQSGSLHPFPYHFSTEFWKNNFENLMIRRSDIIKSLKRFLKSEDANNIWIAANDIYRIVEVYPESVAIIRQLDIHLVLFGVLSSNTSEDVRFHAMEALSACYTKE